MVCWDYHVFLLQRRADALAGRRTLVWDLDRHARGLGAACGHSSL